MDRLARRVAEVNKHIRLHGIRTMTAIHDDLAGVGSELLTGYAYGEFYDWDLYFENLYLSHFGLHRYCRTNVEEFLGRQLPSGFVSRTLLRPRERQHFKPFLAQTVLLGCRQSGDVRWVRGGVYHRLKAYLDYWFWYCDHDRNGLPVWDSADHSGMDNQASRAGALNSERVEGVDLACYLLRELRAMELLAGMIGESEEAITFAAQATGLEATINDTFWDDLDGFYYDRDERTGQEIRVKSAAGFTPIWAGNFPDERIRRLVTEHLLDPEEFWLSFPIATYAKTEPDYYQARERDECNWRGPAWIPVNYMALHGLIRHGYHAAAEELAYRTFEMAISEESTREYYNAETGAGQGLFPFWGWSALAYVMPLEFEAGYDPTDLATPVRPLIRDLLGIAFVP
jgi:neutral trehalase